MRDDDFASELRKIRQRDEKSDQETSDRAGCYGMILLAVLIILILICSGGLLLPGG